MLTTWDPVRLLDRMVDDVMHGQFGTATNPRSYAPEVDVKIPARKACPIPVRRSRRAQREHRNHPGKGGSHRQRYA